MRRFIDSSFAEAAYGYDLATHVAAPHVSHPVTAAASWSAGCSDLAGGVAACQLTSLGFEFGSVTAAIQKRLREDYFDVVLFDLTMVAEAMDNDKKVKDAPFFDAILIPRIKPTGDFGYLSKATFKDCVIELIDVTEIDNTSAFPQFESCLIGKIEGWPKISLQFRGNFKDCEISEYSSEIQTTAGILDLNLRLEERVALVILKKVYLQTGSGRKESALVRGLPLIDRSAVSGVIGTLLSAGYLIKGAGRRGSIFFPAKKQRARVGELLQRPNDFTLELL